MFDNMVKKAFIQRLKTIQYGEIRLMTPENEILHFKGTEPGPTAELRLKDWRVVIRLSIKGDIGFSEDYRDGYACTPDLKTLLYVVLNNEACFNTYLKGNIFYQLIIKLGYLTKRNRIQQSKKNIQAHYDLGNEFYALWLDKSMTYSSGIYQTPSDTLEDAQRNKYQRILKSLEKQQGTILEIGCGWGGFIEEAMKHGDYHIKGITLSENQQTYCLKRLEAYSNKINIAREDYRHQNGSYDYIVSIEMLEAVGENYWGLYFSQIKQLLGPQGKAIIQTILIDDERFEAYAKGTDMIRTHIFPGGMLPCLSVLNSHLEKAGLKLISSYAFGQDYAKTLDAWLSSFEAQSNQLCMLGFDERFQRMWIFYLSACIAAFREQRIDVIQLEVRHAE